MNTPYHYAFAYAEQIKKDAYELADKLVKISGYSVEHEHQHTSIMDAVIKLRDQADIISELQKEQSDLIAVSHQFIKLSDDEKKHIWLDIWFENKNPTVLDIFNHIEKAILRKAQEE